jgi:hypothetical protein
VKAAGWTPEPFEADDGSVPFERFIEDLSDFKFVALDAAIHHVLAVRGIGLMHTEWMRALGRGLHEFRVRHDGDEIARMFSVEARPALARPEKVLIRVFVHFYGDRIVLLLGGYDKGRYPQKKRQQREIARARKLLRQFKHRRRLHR